MVPLRMSQRIVFKAVQFFELDGRPVQYGGKYPLIQYRCAPSSLYRLFMSLECLDLFFLRLYLKF
ncbi:hypothetical protein BB562_12470 [Lactiplantibacillus pentosus]|nr:hypothetical protein BB562_12470 [Lactiplantibacillus pentosus]